MRKSLSRKSRLAFAGMTSGAVVAALLVAPQAAFAVAVSAISAVSPAAGPIGTTVTATATTGTYTAGLGVLLTTLGTCPSYSATANTTTVAAASVTPVVGGTTATFVIPNSTVMATAANGLPKAFKVCAYPEITTPASFIDVSGGFTLTPPVTLGTATGLSGGGNTITVSSGTNTIFASTPGVLFATGSCPTLYPASSSAGVVLASGVTKNSTTSASVIVPAGVIGAVPPGTGATPVTSPYNTCVYATAATNATQIGAALAAYGVSLPSATPAVTTGPAGGNGITVTFGNNALINATTPGVAFTTATTCPTSYPAANGSVTVLAAAGSPRRLASTRLAVTVPTIAVGNYLMCVYNAAATNSPLVAAANYAAVVVPTPTGIVPRSGPALGNNLITVLGTSFPTAPGLITATLGGAPLRDITPISDTAFTAIAPAHPVGDDVPLIITTSAGPKVLQAAYTYSNAIQVSPNTSPNTTPAVDVSVLGVGFLSQSFDGSLPGAHIYLVNGVYNPAASTFDANRKARGAVAECANVLVLSDSELVCTMQLNRRLDEAGGIVDPASYINQLADVVTTGTGSSKVITSPGGGFSLADVGQPILDTAAATKIGPGVTVAAVLSPTTALLSANALTAGTGLAVTIGGAQVVVSNPGGTTSTLTVASGLLAGDVNRTIVGPGIAASTVITASSTTTATVTTGNLTGAGGAIAVVLGTPVASVATISGSAVVTAPDSSFASSDIGRHVIGSGIQPGTTIVAVAALGAGATLSTPATATATVTVTVGGSGSKVVTGLTTDAGGNITAPALTFSLADIGRTITTSTISSLPITAASVTTGGTVAAVSASTVGSGLVGTITGGASSGTPVTGVTKTAGDNNVTAAANTFTRSQIGMTIAGPGIPVGTTITGITFNGNGATLSQPAVSSGAVTVYLFTGVPVSDGAYNLTYVTNGNLGAAVNDLDYSQSVVSSGSTFTVASA